MTRKGKIEGIEVGRGVAASLVALHHAGNLAAQPRFFGVEGFGGHLGNFNVGIDFFFVLSGFIIAWVHWRDIGERGRVRRYAVRRFVRIYPPYWGVVIPLILLYQLFPLAGVPTQHDFVNGVFSLLLLPYPHPPVLGVAWTLVHEVFFYALFGFIIVVGWRAIWLFPAWGALIVAGQVIPHLDFPWGFVLSPFNIEFLFGAAAAIWLRSHTLRFPTFFFLAGMTVFIGSMLLGTHIQDDLFIGRLVFGLSALATLAGMVEYERSYQINVPSYLKFFGEASYAIYLVHPVAESLASHAVTVIFLRTQPVEISIFVLAVTGIVCGCAYHWLIEQPLRSYLTAHLLGSERLRTKEKWT
jgi:peptidoglycan/LPS O-acetylase OafA/YrhL